MCSLAREMATTRASSGEAGAGGSGGRGSTSATLSPAALAPRASRVARQAPTGPPPTTTTSNMAHRQPAGQARRRAAETGTDACQRALRRGREVENQQAEVAQESDSEPAVAEELHQRVGKADDPEAIACTPGGEALQQRRCTDVAARVDYDLSQHRRIAQPEVEALPGHRMQGLRRVADEHGARRDGRGGARELQGIGCAPPGTHEASGTPAEQLLQLRQPRGVGKGQQFFRTLWRAGT